MNFTGLTTEQLIEGIRANKSSSLLDEAIAGGQISEGKLYFDPQELFDKPRKCCLQLPIPVTQYQVNFVLDKLEWLVTDEGKAYSEYFNFIEDYE